MRKIELLVPASSLEVLKIAVIFGADAVYIGGEAFGLRAKAKNFSHEDMKEGIAFAHEHGVKVYVTVNILAHNYDLPGVREYLTELKELKPDALIIADPGIYMYAKEICPEIERHISTQANNTNYETYRFWYNLGAKRVVTARELSLAEIKEIREHIPEDMEIETFIHGAMCISYSGRCLLSNYLAGRDANQGACTHPCRWKYSIVEEKRPGEYMPVFENERGTYIFNSKDLCMIEHMDDIINSGIDSLKIEGRMKTALYVATVARTYRKAIDDYMESPEKYQANMWLLWRVPIEKLLMIIWKVRKNTARICPGIRNRFPTVPTDSLQPDSSMENRMRIHRFMIIILIRRNIRIWDLLRQWMNGVMRRSLREINSL